MHPLSRQRDNARLYVYESTVKANFDAIGPTLARVSDLRRGQDFAERAQAIARAQLGFALPDELLADARAVDLDMRCLFAHCVFATYQRFSDQFFADDPLDVGDPAGFQAFLASCGYHTLDITPCADGRLAHVISYALRLPYQAVRRRPSAGAMFDVDVGVRGWVEAELRHVREVGSGRTDGSPLRYLKAVVYHFSSVDPDHAGCTAHGSDTQRAIARGLQRLLDLQRAVRDGFSDDGLIDLLLVGLDTDTDAIRVHMPDADGLPDLDRYIDALTLYRDTEHLAASDARRAIAARIGQVAPDVVEGSARLIGRLLEHNLSQIDYVRAYHGGCYADGGHAERFVGVGIGLDEVQLRNLGYLAHANTVEETVADLDVAIEVFSTLNLARGLSIPVVVCYDYHSQTAGARERALTRCQRVTDALRRRYRELAEQGLLHTLSIVRDRGVNGRIEVLACSVRRRVGEDSSHAIHAGRTSADTR